MQGIDIGQLVALLGPEPWACRVICKMPVEPGGPGPLYPLAEHWLPGEWYYLRRIYPIVTEENCDPARRFCPVWAHETQIDVMADPLSCPAGCLRWEALSTARESS